MPYKKPTRSAQLKKIMLICGIAVTGIALAAAAVFAVNTYQKNKEEKEAAALEALPRIVVPEGHFQLESYDRSEPEKSVKAAMIIPGTDFYTDENNTAEELEKQVKSIIAQAKKLGLNSVFVDLSLGDKVIYRSSALESTAVDALSVVAEQAALAEMTVGAIFDVQGTRAAYQEESTTSVSPNRRESLVAAVEELARRYELASLTLNKYYLADDSRNYAEFFGSGGDGDYEAWLVDANTALMKELVSSVKAVKPSLPLGLYIDDIWQTDSDGVSGGCPVNASFEALTDGHADTKAMIESRLFDFVNISIPQSLLDPDQPFKTVADYWGDICKSVSVPMYVTHAGENVASTEIVGWNGTDELPRQISTAIKSGNYYGSLFTGLGHISDNPGGSTDYLIKYLNGEMEEEEIFADLDISLPTKKSIVTYEEEQQFRMKFDPNAEVYLNGEQIVPSERGGASVWVPLDVGANSIVLEHKGKKLTYSIERRVEIFHSVNPTQSLKIAGGSTLEVSVIAYQGSTITAAFNGQTITLTEGGGSDEISETKYVNYFGSFTAPKATAKEQNVGQITFKGSYQGYNESEAGSQVTIDRLPDWAEPDSLTGQVLQMATVNMRYANTYPYQTTATYAEAVLFQLPAGTQDIVLSQNGNFLNLRSGKTISAASANVSDEVFEGNNAITAMNVYQENNDTVIEMTMNWQSPFSLTPSPYPSQPITSKNGYYFAADTITLAFDYVTTVAEGVNADMSGSGVFSGMSYKLAKNQAYNINQMVFTLPLAQTGKYYGCAAEWNGNTLTLRFNQAPDSGSLSGMVIVVDPGHGGTDYGNMAGRDVIEKDVNLMQAEYVKSALEAYGATVVMTRDNDSTVSLEQRVETAHQYNADLFLSVHHNSSGSNAAPNGPQTYYNAPFSQPLARSIQEQLNAVMPDNGWNGWIGKNFLVARERQYPSVLVECGFLSNPYDEALAQDPTHMQAVAEAIAGGVAGYYN